MGGKEDTLRTGYEWDVDGLYWKMKADPSDDVSDWSGVLVACGRVVELDWTQLTTCTPLTGTMPAEIGALEGLTYLDLGNNQICGHLSSEIGRLTSLKGLHLNNNLLEGPLPAELGALTALAVLYLQTNSFTGEIPSTLANLTNITYLNLGNNKFGTDVPCWMSKEKAQAYLATLSPKNN